jgi:hypothetical protein
VDQAVEIVKCIPDGADVTDVNIEVLASRGMLPSWELIVIWRKARFAYREPDCGPRARRAPCASTSLLLTRLRIHC